MCTTALPALAVSLFSWVERRVLSEKTLQFHHQPDVAFYFVFSRHKGGLAVHFSPRYGKPHIGGRLDDDIGLTITAFVERAFAPLYLYIGRKLLLPGDLKLIDSSLRMPQPPWNCLDPPVLCPFYADSNVGKSYSKAFMLSIVMVPVRITAGSNLKNFMTATSYPSGLRQMLPCVGRPGQ